VGLIFSAVDVPEGFLLEWWSIHSDFDYFRKMHVSYPLPSLILAKSSWFITAIV